MTDEIGEINTTYDQDQEIGDTPNHYPAGGAEPIDAKTGQDFLDIDWGEEGIKDVIGDIFSGNIIFTKDEREELKKILGEGKWDYREKQLDPDLVNPDARDRMELEKDILDRTQEDPNELHGYAWQVGQETLDEETRQKIKSDIERSEAPETVEDLERWASRIGVSAEDYIQVFDEGGYMFEEDFAMMYGDESLNQDGTGIKHATRGLNPNTTKRNLVSFIYVSKSDCDICKQYDGRTFSIDSPNRPIIPRLEHGGSNSKRPFTHPHCKCKWTYPFSDEDLRNERQLEGSEVKQETIDGTREWVTGKGVDYDKLNKSQQYVAMIQYLTKDDATEDNPNHFPEGTGGGKGGQFAPKDGGNDFDGSPTKNKPVEVSKLLKKYPSLNKSFAMQQIEKADGIRAMAVKSNSEIKKNLGTIPNVEITGRIKKANSMVGKLARKPDEYKDVSDLYDVSGVRTMAKDLTGVSDAIGYIRENYKVIQEKDNINEDRGGYRSYHAIVEKDGIKHEIQVRTENQDVWANWAHDIYKPPTDELEEFVNANKEILSMYSSAMSQYFYEKDMGKEPRKPDCPPEIEGEIGCMA